MSYAKAALLPAELWDAQRTLTAEFTLPWRPCSTIIFLPDHPEHHPMPAWLNPYDQRIIEDKPKRYKPKRTMYEHRLQSLARRYGKDEAHAVMLKEMRAFLAGFDDVRGNHWCGQCFEQYQLINLGDALGYPRLWSPETSPGFHAWFFVARFHGGVAVASALRNAQQIKVKQAQDVHALEHPQPLHKIQSIA